jgi:hypothetical protein
VPLREDGRVPVAPRLFALLACLASAAAVLTTALPANASQTSGSNVLSTGQCLSADATHPGDALQSANTRFELALTRTALFIHNEVMLTADTAAGYTTWQQMANRRAGGSARLCMRTDGNLVLRGDDGVMWSSHTAGSGAHNYAIMRNNGRLVVRTGSGQRVWTSNTTPVLLTAGDRLLGGQTLRNMTSADGVTRLAMQPNGDLVLSRGATTVWHSRTGIEGAHLEVTTAGQLVIRTPAGKAIWQSTAVGSTPLLTVAQHGRITLESFDTGRCWARPQGSC